MSARFLRTTQRGQSIPLIALLIVVLVGAVGLAVDVGNTYAQQRNTVRATNAAALSGMNALIQGGGDRDIGQVIQQSLRSNKIDGVYDDNGVDVRQTDQRLIQAYYLDSKGNYLATCTIGSCGSVPSGVTYIQVKVNGDVNTYFARVLDRPTLPVKAQAFAGRCSPIEGVYPIGVQSSNLDQNGFLPPQNPADLPFYKIYKDSNYPNGLTQRRIYLKDEANSPGNFSFLRWKAASNAGSGPEMISMMAGAGNLAEKFDEGLVDNQGNVTWPDPNSQAPTVAGKVVYPVKPHEINAGDWVYANSGLNIAGFKANVQEHIDRKDVMILPIVKPAVGTGTKATFQIAGLGSFYIVGQGGNGANSYFDMVYIGTANSIACLSTPAVTSSTLGINGAVFLKPRWGEPQAGQPIAYEIIMDVSGSMSWNFDGQGNENGSGKLLQCEQFGNIPAVGCNGSNDYWKNQNERRIFVLKDAMTRTGGFIDSLRTGDVMRIITFTTDSNNKVSVNTGPDWSSNKSALKSTVMSAGTYKGNQYLTYGGTPGPSALNKAAAILQSSPPPAPANGQAYKHAVVYLTDGVANIFLDGTTNYAKDICPEYNGGAAALSTPRCQYDPPPDYRPNSQHGMRPITAMIAEAGKMKNSSDSLQLFVVALGQVNALGLDEVASDPKLVFPARSPDLVSRVLAEIKAKAEGPCIENTNPDWVSHIDQGHIPTLPNLTLPSGVYGYVYLYDANFTPVSLPWTGQGADPRGAATNAIPITQDGVGEQLSYSLPTQNGLIPGSYYYNGYVGYKAAAPDGDGVSRIYDQIKPGLTTQQYASFTLTPSQVLGASVVLDPLRLLLAGDKVVCN